MGSIPTVVSVILVVAGAIGVPLALYVASRSPARRPRPASEADESRPGIEQLLKQTEATTASLLRQAERDAERLRKETLLDARERAHTIAAEAEREAQTRRQVTVIRETRAVDYAR